MVCVVSVSILCTKTHLLGRSPWNGCPYCFVFRRYGLLFSVRRWAIMTGICIVFLSHYEMFLHFRCNINNGPVAFYLLLKYGCRVKCACKPASGWHFPCRMMSVLNSSQPVRQNSTDICIFCMVLYYLNPAWAETYMCGGLGSIPGQSAWDLWGNKVAFRQTFLRRPQFSSVSIISLSLHIHVSFIYHRRRVN